ncbi:TonB-dependent receptor domain-containing protein [Salinivibrio socompensis]|uniref:TonB-dependent receptor domain-containing protein n=1 Tax=Salinivibrio socompensis TaxID=1510206 RepID=UPI0004B71EC2|nr:TonB-dependent receptor [Salinivibrio socompensis]
MSIGQWRVMLGLRADAYRLSADDPQAIGMASVADNNSAALSPSASVAYHWTPAFNTYLSYKHGYRAPEYDKSYGYSNHASMPGMAFVVLPNPSLDAETSDSFELGAKYDDGKLRLYTAAYYNRFSQFIDIADKGFNAETGLFEKRYENLNGVKTYGVEASAAYAFTDQWQAKSQIGWISGKDDDDEYVRNLAPLEGSVSLHFDNQSFNGYTV